METITRGLATFIWVMCLLPSLAPQIVVTDHTPYQALVQALVQPGETVWLAPAEFQDWLMIDADNAAAPYYFIYPWLWDDPSIQETVQARLKTQRPVLIVYRRDQAVAGIEAWTLPAFAPTLTAWVDQYYLPLPGEPDVYLLRDRYEELAARRPLE